ncbi:hypothetical protein FO488_11615 [Geobacter sp. FeAm09]|uniref:vitamin K epoxide reductase family protein n=1 Tax=Geobacter sp. FeAm09 TaxID=2597769 RepID=UPI0011ED7943|nr:vitamin K epoxide reductase family protein [Geobacter sp. FeAm09]QEM68737.1 hypothetical protein FO488_11615 [Geobacter sp. FeAm09]
MNNAELSLFHRTILALLCLAGGVVSALSGIKELCSDACTAAHTFSFFNLPMQLLGVAYFVGLLAVAIILGKARKPAWWRRIFTAMVTMGMGAEIWFVGIQVFQIKRICIFCAVVAGIVAIVALLWGALQWRPLMETIRGGSRMNMVGRLMARGALVLTALGAGALISFAGLRPGTTAGEVVNPYIGNQMSPVEVIFITDWYCPSCLKAEPAMTDIVTKLSGKAKFTFIELNIHENSYNYVPANLSFLINEKRDYLKLRRALHTLAAKTPTPSEEELRNLARQCGVTYKPLPLSVVIKGLQFAAGIVSSAGINSTPTVLVVNRKSGANTVLQGDKAITLDAVGKAVDAVARGRN